jgi:hypothetical protein
MACCVIRGRGCAGPAGHQPPAAAALTRRTWWRPPPPPRARSSSSAGSITHVWKAMAGREGWKALFKGMSYPLFTTALQVTRAGWREGPHTPPAQQRSPGAPQPPAAAASTRHRHHHQPAASRGCGRLHTRTRPAPALTHARLSPPALAERHHLPRVRHRQAPPGGRWRGHRPARNLPGRHVCGWARLLLTLMLLMLHLALAAAWPGSAGGAWPGELPLRPQAGASSAGPSRRPRPAPRALRPLPPAPQAWCKLWWARR